MNKDIHLDLEDVFYLLNLLPAMKDIPDPQRYMDIITKVQLQSKDEMSVPVEPHKVKLYPPPSFDFTHNVGKKSLIMMDSISEEVNPWVEVPFPTPTGSGGDEEPNYFKISTGQIEAQNKNVAFLKIRAIKMVREILGIGLKEAKDAVEVGMNFHIPLTWSKEKISKRAEDEGLLVEFS